MTRSKTRGSPDIVIRELTGTDTSLMHALLDLFGRAFDQTDVYGDARPDEEYLGELLDARHFVALVAMDGSSVVGGLAAYELVKFEQRRSEIYLYDLAVDSAWRRQGVATQLIQALRNIAAGRGAWVVFVQADVGDEPAIALYDALGVREDVLHFDIPVARGR